MPPETAPGPWERQGREPLPEGGEAPRSCKADPGSRRKKREDGPMKETARRQWWGKPIRRLAVCLQEYVLCFLEP